MARNAVVNLVIQSKDRASRGVKAFRNRLRRLKQDFLSLGGVVGKLAVTFGAVFGTQALARFFGGSIEAFKEQQSAVEGLRAALEQTGRAGENALDRIVKKAAEVQAVTTAGDEALIAATADLALLAKELPAEELERSQKAVVAIADVFLKGDTRNAAQLLGKTLGSSTNALTRYGIEIDTTATQQEKLNQVLEQTAEMFEVSKAKADTLEGRTQQLKNVWGDLREAMGEIIVRSIDLQGETEGLTGRIKSLSDELIGNMGFWVAWGQVVKDAALFAGSVFKNTLKIGVNLLEGIGIVLIAIVQETVSQALILISQVNTVMNEMIKGVNRVSPVDLPLFATHFDTAAKLHNDAAGNVAALWERVAKDIGDAFVNTGNRMGDLAASWDLIEHRIEQFRKTMKGAIRDTGELAETAGPTGGGGAGGAGTPRARLRGRGAGLSRAPRQDVLGAGLPMVPGADVPGVLGSAGFGAEFQENIRETLGPLESLDQKLAGIATGSLMQLGQGFEDIFASVVSGSASAGEAAAKFALGFIGNAASAMGDWHLAQAIGKLGEGTWPPNPAAIKSAGHHFAAAAAFKALAGTAKGFGSRGGGRGGGVGIGTGGLTRSQQNALNRPRGSLTLVIEGGLLDTSDPRQSDALARALSDIGNRDVTVVHR